MNQTVREREREKERDAQYHDAYTSFGWLSGLQISWKSVSLEYIKNNN